MCVKTLVDAWWNGWSWLNGREVESDLESVEGRQRLGQKEGRAGKDMPTGHMRDGSTHTNARRLPQLSACSREAETEPGESRRARREVGGDLSSGSGGAREGPALFVDSSSVEASYDVMGSAVRGSEWGCIRS